MTSRMIPTAGTTPKGATSEESAALWVRGMFGRVARRYDLLNHLLSFNLDKRWRRRAVERLADVLTQPHAKVLDLCCGTGDVLLSMEARRGTISDSGQPDSRAAIIGSDFCHPMLIEARRKIAGAQLQSPLFEADALALPLAHESLDLITVAFGFRNLANYQRGLYELERVLKPGGVLAVLEFSQPTNRVFRALYGFFSKYVLPLVGGLISGSRDAYSYLPESIRKFPRPEELAHQMRDCGFSSVEFEGMTFGVVTLHIAKK
jgi:demethylmenaquinone methyltransferase / 2-methoxy-6-polyprenyl-1,4-benzoquinol methylase